MTITILGSGQSNAVATSSYGKDLISNVTKWDNTDNETGGSNLGDSWDAPTSSSMFLQFASELAKQTGEAVRLVSVSFSGNPISGWVTEGDVTGVNYARIEAVLAAASLTSVDMFLWHQGEADDSLALSTSYQTKFNNLIGHLTDDGYIDGSTPIIAGQVATRDGFIWTNPNLAALAKADPRMGLARLKDLATSDGVHFSGPSLVAAGKLYAEALSDTETTYKGMMPVAGFGGKKVMVYDQDFGAGRLANIADVRATVTQREVLTRDRTYYVKPSSGSDGNDGLDSASPFATIEKARDTILQTLDVAGFSVVITLLDDTYTITSPIKFEALPPGMVTWEILGNTSTPANVDITGGVTLFRLSGVRVSVNGIGVETTNSGSSCFFLENGAALSYLNVDFGDCTRAHIEATDGSAVKQLGAYSVSGGAAQHWSVSTGARVIAEITATITMTNTPKFTWGFAQCTRGGIIRSNNLTFSGTMHVDSKRWLVETGGLISVPSASATYFPGNVAGETNSPGAYTS